MTRRTSLTFPLNTISRLPLLMVLEIDYHFSSICILDMEINMSANLNVIVASTRLDTVCNKAFETGR